MNDFVQYMMSPMARVWGPQPTGGHMGPPPLWFGSPTIPPIYTSLGSVGGQYFGNIGQAIGSYFDRAASYQQYPLFPVGTDIMQQGRFLHQQDLIMRLQSEQERILIDRIKERMRHTTKLTDADLDTGLAALAIQRLAQSQTVQSALRVMTVQGTSELVRALSTYGNAWRPPEYNVLSLQNAFLEYYGMLPGMHENIDRTFGMSLDDLAASLRVTSQMAGVYGRNRMLTDTRRQLNQFYERDIYETIQQAFRDNLRSSNITRDRWSRALQESEGNVVRAIETLAKEEGVDVSSSRVDAIVRRAQEAIQTRGRERFGTSVISPEGIMYHRLVDQSREVARLYRIFTDAGYTGTLDNLFTDLERVVGSDKFNISKMQNLAETMRTLTKITGMTLDSVFALFEVIDRRITGGTIGARRASMLTSITATAGIDLAGSVTNAGLAIYQRSIAEAGANPTKSVFGMAIDVFRLYNRYDLIEEYQKLPTEQRPAWLRSKMVELSGQMPVLEALLRGDEDLVAAAVRDIGGKIDEDIDRYNTLLTRQGTWEGLRVTDRSALKRHESLQAAAQVITQFQPQVLDRIRGASNEKEIRSILEETAANTADGAAAQNAQNLLRQIEEGRIRLGDIQSIAKTGRVESQAPPAQQPLTQQTVQSVVEVVNQFNQQNTGLTNLSTDFSKAFETFYRLEARRQQVGWEKLSDKEREDYRIAARNTYETFRKLKADSRYKDLTTKLESVFAFTGETSEATQMLDIAQNYENQGAIIERALPTEEVVRLHARYAAEEALGTMPAGLRSRFVELGQALAIDSNGNRINLTEDEYARLGASYVVLQERAAEFQKQTGQVITTDEILKFVQSAALEQGINIGQQIFSTENVKRITGSGVGLTSMARAVYRGRTLDYLTPVAFGGVIEAWSKDKQEKMKKHALMTSLAGGFDTVAKALGGVGFDINRLASNLQDTIEGMRASKEIDEDLAKMLTGVIERKDQQTLADLSDLMRTEAELSTLDPMREEHRERRNQLLERRNKIMATISERTPGISVRALEQFSEAAQRGTLQKLVDIAQKSGAAQIAERKIEIVGKLILEGKRRTEGGNKETETEPARLLATGTTTTSTGSSSSPGQQ